MVYAIIWWQTESIERIIKGKKYEWTFSPILGKNSSVAGWVLMSRTVFERCNMKKWHSVDNWNEQMTKQKEPKIPKKVWASLEMKTKKIKKVDPWPGSD